MAKTKHSKPSKKPAKLTAEAAIDAAKQAVDTAECAFLTDPTIAEHRARKTAAQRALDSDFREMHANLDEIDRLIISVLADLASHSELEPTIREVAKIASQAYCIRCNLPSGVAS